MIVSRTPFRISLFGGGTDYPGWYQEHGGSVISTTIDKYCYITCRYLPPFFDYKHRIRYYKREEVNTVDEIEHPAVRECFKFAKIEQGVEIVHNADIPARSGMGSSSTFTVGLLNALYALKHKMSTKRELAYDAIHVEQDLIGENVGSQDQTAAAFGGFNKIDFGGRADVEVSPLILSPENLDKLQSHMMLFFTGFSRTASGVASAQIERIPENKDYMFKMMDIVDSAMNLLKGNTLDVDALAGLLDEQWMIKRDLSPLVTNSKIDEIYDVGKSNGALAGKLLGAGGGGCILFIVKPENRERLKEAMKGLVYIPFRFEALGSHIVYYSHS